MIVLRKFFSLFSPRFPPLSPILRSYLSLLYFFLFSLLLLIVQFLISHYILFSRYFFLFLYCSFSLSPLFSFFNSFSAYSLTCPKLFAYSSPQTLPLLRNVLLFAPPLSLPSFLSRLFHLLLLFLDLHLMFHSLLYRLPLPPEPVFVNV